MPVIHRDLLHEPSVHLLHVETSYSKYQMGTVIMNNVIFEAEFQILVFVSIAVYNHIAEMVLFKHQMGHDQLDDLMNNVTTLDPTAIPYQMHVEQAV